MIQNINIQRLSPSKINTINDCSWKYYCSYHLNLPRSSNDGSRRGTICHGLFERLISPKHRHYINEILEFGCPFKISVIKKYLENYAVKENLDLDAETVNLKKNGLITHREEISRMIIVGLQSDFLGEGYDEIIAEQVHEENVEINEKRYFIKGIIDKMFLKKDGDGNIVKVKIVDYKTSSKKFDKKKIDLNMQGLIYQIFARRMYPTAKEIEMSFLFLRFPDDPWVIVPQVSKEIMEGVEYYLTYLSNYLTAFTEEHAKKNFAKFNSNCFLCGLYGKKKYYDKDAGQKIETNESQFLCDVRDPFYYWAVVNRDGKTIRSEMDKNKIKLKDGETIQRKRYMGCPCWHAQKDSIDRDWGELS